MLVVREKVLVTQLYLTRCDPMDCSLSGFSVHGILQARILEWVAIPFPREKKCKTEKWLSGEAFQIAVKRREAKGKGEKERYTHWHAEF